MQKKFNISLGAHMSIMGGFYKAILRGEEIGCTAIALFTKSNRQWQAKPLTQEGITLFKETYAKSTVRSIVAHAGYLINLGCLDQKTYKASIDSLKEELDRCEKLSIPSLVFHPGTYNPKVSLNHCLELVAHGINTILDAIAGESSLVIETMSGQGNSLGSQLEQLEYIYKLISSKNKKRVGFCVDTCHIFTAGYDIRTSAGYEQFFTKFDYLLGIEKIKVFHLNDSKRPFGSKLDRHEFIGKGHIGLEPFKILMNDSRFIAVPKILEVPIDTYYDYIPDLTLLKSFIK
jgi:deoxyribonuclease-4